MPMANNEGRQCCHYVSSYSDLGVFGFLLTRSYRDSLEVRTAGSIVYITSHLLSGLACE